MPARKRSNAVVVKLKVPPPLDSAASLTEKSAQLTHSDAALANALRDHVPEPAFIRDDGDGEFDKLLPDSIETLARGGTRRSQYWRIPVANETEARAVVEALKGLPDIVEWVDHEPVPYVQSLGSRIDFATSVVSAGDTDDFSALQTYLDDAPVGLGIRKAWTVAGAGGAGSGVSAADVELGWVLDHEEFEGVPLTRRGTMSTDDDDLSHGTACLGMVLGRWNSRGIVGIAPAVSHVHCFAVRRSLLPLPAPNTNHEALWANNAIDLAAKALDPGDVLLIELEIPGPVVGNNRIPIEYFDIVYQSVLWATQKGIIVVASAGNGKQDLDDPRLDRKFDRDVRDSGAIFVGSGAPRGISGMPDLTRIDISNWGRCVDVQGYGATVHTSGYGDLRRDAQNTPQRRYTKSFRGTSSAAAMVWGACLLIQSVARHAGRTITPREMRDVLKRTGTRQVGTTKSPESRNIGPRPDVYQALVDLGLA